MEKWEGMDLSTNGQWQRNGSISVNGRSLYRFVLYGLHDLKRSTREFTREISERFKDVVVFAGIRSRTFKYGEEEGQEGIGTAKGLMTIGVLREVSRVAIQRLIEKRKKGIVCSLDADYEKDSLDADEDVV